jgi:hypothetical protein
MAKDGLDPDLHVVMVVADATAKDERAPRGGRKKIKRRD